MQKSASQKNSSSKSSTAPSFPSDHDVLYKEAYLRSINEPEKFWDEIASQSISWDKMYNQVLDNSNPPFTKWFCGGYLNACYNCIDRHVANGNGNKVALIQDSPITNTIRRVTYSELLDTISRLAGGLKKLGVGKGDRVVIYMPLIPEVVIAMLATVRIGAVHSVVFGGFASSELSTRIEHAEPKVVISASCGVEPNKVIPYIDILHEAIEMSHWKPDKCIIYQRKNILVSELDPHMDLCWESAMAEPAECVSVEANDPLYILYTSGTTDKPKGVQRPVGHIVTLMYTMNTIYGLRPDDVWWAASDLGWVVGHSYIAYGPLLYGSTSVMYEGKPDRTPDPGQYFRIIEQHQVSAIFSVPTAFRVIRKVDPHARYGSKYSLSSLKRIFIAGEHCDLETKNWMENIFKVPVLNHWWQTETGSAITATCVGYSQNLNVPNFTTGLPFVGYDIKVMAPDAKKLEELGPNQLGRILLKLPLPPGNMSTLYRNDDLYEKVYFTRFPGYYDTMDAGYKDESGYIYVTARDDDVINVAGHRISTSSLEDAILRHQDVADCAVFGVPEHTKGQVPLCLYVTKDGVKKPPAKISVEIIKTIREVIGPIASFRLVAKVQALPRTRSGKTMRKALADFARNKTVNLPATIEDPSVFIDIRRALNELGYANSAPSPLYAVKKRD
ncbi:unnamed protein product [Chironomus riparius]|uniref:Acyl-CoA synthetase short-chain family member 3, mitochondrial n=1 Tax=Chironomus riparius TaxID=315576 RepID=A0A9N9WYU0_9DIPT|nr:unnamed protein product [Chironomus riparius]